ncbi:TPA: Rpn family recombination-promoting nuclease/putative transposase [Streptococcus suis]|nr:Rpn family recombination-promoting nuclease/putative transposase [Streptococcus suis]HEM5098513.1 Rpn family recombination-promoting nuclease/putative transposase [Streptococcus suis]HEM5100552.1 Rpn family recombination-promoting nuclease/putative transposase [Streptococcus suis]HEM5101843.1 Rpn family recombination-promoting nuclease/putative transposase [Streptococcus suis]HEM5109082.1 Rpn family recombination-promoting nuclease/putative transposase [Streptococcus suis]
MRHSRLKPTQDTVAKKIFQNKEVTKAFVSDILNLAVTEVELLDGHQISLPNDHSPRGFYTVTDILVKLDDGTQVIIEIQIVKQKFFINRLWTYICTQVHDNFEQARQEHGDTHTTHEWLYPVYGIALVEKNYFDDDLPFHIFSLREESTNQELFIQPKNSDKQHSLVKLAFLELSKYQPETISEYDLKKWFEFFGNRDFTIQPDKIISQAEHALDYTTWTKEEQDMWDKEFDREELYYSSLREAREEAREETEQKERLQFAQRLLAEGLDNDIIARCTTLPLSLVEQLRSQLATGG